VLLRSVGLFGSKLSLTGLSDNVGGVKHFLSVLIHALLGARHFALVEELPYQPRLARNRYQVRNSVRPMHLFGRNFDHDYYFRLPSEGERAAQSIARRLYCAPWPVPSVPACEPNFFTCS
jgi:hypothetical protein